MFAMPLLVETRELVSNTFLCFPPPFLYNICMPLQRKAFTRNIFGATVLKSHNYLLKNSQSLHIYSHSARVSRRRAFFSECVGLGTIAGSTFDPFANWWRIHFPFNFSTIITIFCTSSLIYITTSPLHHRQWCFRLQEIYWQGKGKEWEVTVGRKAGRKEGRKNVYAAQSNNKNVFLR